MNSPVLELSSLDQLWFQVSGTICNISCEHCFISCSPTNHSFEMMSPKQIYETLEQAKEIGVKEFYFTGGEPFIHPQIVEILDKTLEIGPATVLTNGLVLKDSLVSPLSKIHNKSKYSLEIRVSLDSFIEAEHDKLRGKGNFQKTLLGIKKLVEYNFLPIITATRTWDDSVELEAQTTFKNLLHQLGYTKPRLKILPVIKIGKEAERGNTYTEFEKITDDMMIDYDKSQLLCHHSRIATSKGFYTCPILIDYPEANLGDNINDSLQPIKLQEQACYTCYLWGGICANVSSGESYAR